MVQSVKRAFELEAYNVQLKINDGKTVKSSFIRLQGLPYELGLSPHRSEVLAVKVELDTNPPKGGTTTTTVIRRNILLNLSHHLTVKVRRQLDSWQITSRGGLVKLGPWKWTKWKC